MYKITEDLKLKKPAFLKDIQGTINANIQMSRSLSSIESKQASSSMSLSSSSTTLIAKTSPIVKKAPSNISQQKASTGQSHVLSPQAIAKAKMLSKMQSYNNTHYHNFSSKFNWSREIKKENL